MEKRYGMDALGYLSDVLWSQYRPAVPAPRPRLAPPRAWWGLLTRRIGELFAAPQPDMAIYLTLRTRPAQAAKRRR